jgi:hypothetical protein
MQCYWRRNVPIAVSFLKTFPVHDSPEGEGVAPATQSPPQPHQSRWLCPGRNSNPTPSLLRIRSRYFLSVSDSFRFHFFNPEGWRIGEQKAKSSERRRDMRAGRWRDSPCNLCALPACTGAHKQHGRAEQTLVHGPALCRRAAPAPHCEGLLAIKGVAFVASRASYASTSRRPVPGGTAVSPPEASLHTDPQGRVVAEASIANAVELAEMCNTIMAASHVSHFSEESPYRNLKGLKRRTLSATVFADTILASSAISPHSRSKYPVSHSPRIFRWTRLYKLRGLSLRANYSDRATAACRRS